MAYFPQLYSIFGLVVGSFLNVCIYRIPRNESIVFPASHCPRCGSAVRPYDNVPLFSYLWLRGKCRSCKASISLQYPLVEFLTGLAFFACARKWELAEPAFTNSLFLALILLLVFIDYHHQILPNVITLPGAVAGFLLSPFQSQEFFADALSWNLAALVSADNPGFPLPWMGSLLGALVGSGLLFAVGFLYQLLRSRQGLGMGDIKMMAFVGAFLGWRLALLTIFAGSLLGSIVGIFLVLFHGKTLQTKLAFGTFLGAGAALALFFGPALLRWYVTAG